jgi:leucyl/phenylalanyl-tRNA--protein transferase
MKIIDPAVILEAYSEGYFPMGVQDSENEVEWYTATMRGVIPLDKFKLPKRVVRYQKSGGYHKKINSAFEAIISGCADRESTWINDTIFNTFMVLHDIGVAHSIEVWKEDELCGGLYGIAIGGAFFAESVYQAKPECMKIALGYCHEELVQRGFTLWDVQFYNDFLGQFGCVEIKPNKYNSLLQSALIGSPSPFIRPDKSDIQF